MDVNHRLTHGERIGGRAPAGFAGGELAVVAGPDSVGQDQEYRVAGGVARDLVNMAVLSRLCRVETLLPASNR